MRTCGPEGEGEGVRSRRARERERVQEGEDIQSRGGDGMRSRGRGRGPVVDVCPETIWCVQKKVRVIFAYMCIALPGGGVGPVHLSRAVLSSFQLPGANAAGFRSRGRAWK